MIKIDSKTQLLPVEFLRTIYVRDAGTRYITRFYGLERRDRVEERATRWRWSKSARFHDARHVLHLLLVPCCIIVRANLFWQRAESEVAGPGGRRLARP
jgi:hypothetical protein